MIKLLVDNGVVAAGSVFQSTHAKIPAGDAATITLIEYGGPAPLVMHRSDSNPAYEFPTAQVFARGGSHAQVRALAQAAYLRLSRDPSTSATSILQRPWRNVTINGVYYVWISPRQQPFDMGPDDVGRLKIGFNLAAMKRPSA